jgi:hypothetical protein
MLLEVYTPPSQIQKNHDRYVARICQVVEELMAREAIFQERLHQMEIIGQLTTLLQHIPPEELGDLADDALKQYIGNFMAAQLMPGLLDVHHPQAAFGNNGRNMT